MTGGDSQVSLASTPAGMFIGGEWSTASGWAATPSVNPTTEEIIAEIPSASSGDVDRAVDAAVDAAPSWAALSWTERAGLLRELARRIDDVAEELANIDTIDAGLPISGSLGDVRSAVAELVYMAGLGGESKGQTIPGTPGRRTWSQREPYGVVGRIIPFNHPFKFAISKSAAPLIAGNTVLLKPSEHTSLSALRLAALTMDLLPPGVFNVVTGPASTGISIVEHPRVPRIAFTGGVSNGKAVLRQSAQHVKHVTLELGGKNPMIVFDDVDPDRAAAAAIAGMNLRRTMGQSCKSTSRILVHEKQKAAFLAALVGQVRRLRVGDPGLAGTDMGPLAYRAHYDRVLSYVEAGGAAGARLLTGGERPAGFTRGYFVEPAVFADVDPTMSIAREEIFGPVMSVIDWNDETEMIRIANGVDVGLTANVWTRDLARAHRTADSLDAGVVWINGDGRRPLGTPMGGYKYSGLGLEGSVDELLGFTRSKSVVITYPEV